MAAGAQVVTSTRTHHGEPDTRDDRWSRAHRAPGAETGMGEGFDGQWTPAGQGLRNIRSRAESIDGGFTLTSRPGFGTALEVVLRA